MRRLFRPTEGRMIAGVCAGIANYFNIDVTFVRIICVVLTLPGFIHGILIYIVLMFVMPQESKIVK